MRKLIGYLRLMRPANIVTAVADILAGTAIAGFGWNGNDLSSAFWLIVSTIGLYGGGVVLNDVFDAALDKVERPERPIPSGLITTTAGGLLGAILLVLGVVAAAQVSLSPSFLIALGIAITVLTYDKWAKHHAVIGPLNMGLCRGLNLLLGISIVPSALNTFWWLAVIPIVYVAAITMVSRGEVHGGSKGTLYFAGLLYALVGMSILTVTFYREKAIAVLFISFLLLLVYPPLFKAIQQPSGKRIGKAVKAGVIGLIAMNASWAAAFGMIYLALIIVILLPVSILLARIFTVT